ncbi:putative 14-3-3 protein [Monocercomonoides exilis]|uniref:putative 14-3-3 protein n=1 Tax=Monocercomonoides exilis TaxID=2049356 RepID=UPI003559BAA3|nr:putative 14-3-3 protein [Monocercomonoides exilis]|eukprot:MONOS_51.1-p1 / transcript=MONOS_51.1 / gene=MONOS_51 / organism=Monocercomonoides_exilis_PA203 / gene_product=putative 14-3-3 protein / transcript_product=putative 14-3-3 protein / location=Mono_scaffold00001:275755-276654(-) / protein_length=254 / sequence_SO=supercontig / SO=protein_coding / is_pseudo=false
MAGISEREDAIYMANLYEMSERYQEMADTMTSVAESKTELIDEERKLLSVAYKNIIGTKRASWRVAAAIEAKEEQKGKSPFLKIARQFRKDIQREITEVCEKVITLLDVSLLPFCVSCESKVFFLKMKGDYLRYKCECQNGVERKESAEKALNAYSAGIDEATKSLNPTMPIRLSIFLNYAVFLYEIMNAPAKAIQCARAAFEDGMDHVDEMAEDSYKDATLILQLLRDNLSLWMSDENMPEEVEAQKNKQNSE